MKKSTGLALPVAAGVAAGAVLGVACLTGIGGASGGQPSASSSGLAVAAATESAAGHDHRAAGHDHSAAGSAAAPVEPLARDCSASVLAPHDGNQIGPACVSTAFGEVGAAEDNPQLLITDAPDEVAVGQPFTIKVSTRNLVRDRFLAAAQGGYYRESSSLNDDGIVRGHFHTACRVLGTTDLAPRPERQSIFVATEDGAGGATPDTVTVQIPGMPSAGEAQCTSWAGDGSHRIPMMVFANQMPAVDSIRIRVTEGDGAGAAADDAKAADGGADEGAGSAEADEVTPPSEKGSRAGEPDETAGQADDEQQADTADEAGTAGRAQTADGRRTGTDAGTGGHSHGHSHGR